MTKRRNSESNMSSLAEGLHTQQPGDSLDDNYTSSGASQSAITQQRCDNGENTTSPRFTEDARKVQAVVTQAQERGPPPFHAQNQDSSNLLEPLHTFRDALAIVCCCLCMSFRRKRSQSRRTAVFKSATIPRTYPDDSSHDDCETAVEDMSDPTDRTPLMPQYFPERGIRCALSAPQDPVIRQQAARFYQNSKRRPWYSKLPWIRDPRSGASEFSRDDQTVE